MVGGLRGILGVFVHEYVEKVFVFVHEHVRIHLREITVDYVLVPNEKKNHVLNEFVQTVGREIRH